MIADQRAAEIVRGAINNAASTYKDWTGGWWLSDSGCESLMVAITGRHLASENRKLGSARHQLTLETSLGFVRSKLSNPPKGAIPHTIAKSKRADIVLWSGDKPYGVIEIKRTQQLDGWRDDLNELRQLVHSYTDVVQFGLFGGFLVRSRKYYMDKARATIEKMTPDPRYKSLNEYLEWGPKVHYDPNNRSGDLTYQAVTIRISRK